MAPKCGTSSTCMTAHHSHQDLTVTATSKLVRFVRERLHWFAILLWAITIIVALVPLL